MSQVRRRVSQQPQLQEVSGAGALLRGRGLGLQCLLALDAATGSPRPVCALMEANTALVPMFQGHKGVEKRQGERGKFLLEQSST